MTFFVIFLTAMPVAGRAVVDARFVAEGVAAEDEVGPEGVDEHDGELAHAAACPVPVPAFFSFGLVSDSGGNIHTPWRGHTRTYVACFLFLKFSQA